MGNLIAGISLLAAVHTAGAQEKRAIPPRSSHGLGHYVKKYALRGPLIPLAAVYHLVMGMDADFNPHGVVYGYPYDHLMQIEAGKLGICLAYATAEYRGYSLSGDGYSCRPFPGRKGEPPSLLQYLGAEKDRACDYATGREPELKAWILAQTDNSIDPVALYKKALELNSGGIWNALLTIHQCLRDNARWWVEGRYDYVSTKEGQEAFFNKFIDIRGDLAE